MTYKFDCFYFSGYKPCKFKRSCENCPHYLLPDQRICIISLEAMGAVLRSTCILPPIMRQLKAPHITWITYGNAKPVLVNNPYIHRLLVLDAKTLPIINHLQFDVLYAIDKSLEAGSLAEIIKAKRKFGFGLTTEGAIKPFSKEADYQFAMGLDDNLKFKINQKPETQMITESMGLTWKRDPYVLEFTPEEKEKIISWRAKIKGSAKGIIGFNTGCSLLYPYKKFTVEKSIEVISMWRKNFPDFVVALLGGPEDTERQNQMKAAFGNDDLVVNTPTTNGLREGILWMDTADIVFSGCSLGLNIAIGLKKPTLCWFGVSCAQEIDLYDRGIKLKAKVPCSPCWKKSCEIEPKCYDLVPLVEIKEATGKIINDFVK